MSRALNRAAYVSQDRRADDFYPTPPAATIALVAAERAKLFSRPRTVWEPACGDGAIAKVLTGLGHQVVATDLVDRGYPGLIETADFLDYQDLPAFAATEGGGGLVLVTNPPFSLAPEFIWTAHRLGIRDMALLLRLEFWCAGSIRRGRDRLFEEFPPAAVMPVAWRLDFLGDGKPVVDTAWAVWRCDHVGPTEFFPLRKPRTWAGLSVRGEA